MCDSEAKAPRGTLNALAAGSAAAAAGGGGGTGGGVSNGSAPFTALLACGMPPNGLVRRTFGFTVDMCEAFPSLKSDVVDLMESILQNQGLSKMHGAKGAAKLKKRLAKLLAIITSSDGTGRGSGGGVASGERAMPGPSAPKRPRLA